MFLDNRCYEKDNCMSGTTTTCDCPCVMECPQERVCHMETLHNVPHIIPVNTKIINHHIYRHTYQPMYTTTMEDQVSNVCGGSSVNF